MKPEVRKAERMDAAVSGDREVRKGAKSMSYIGGLVVDGDGEDGYGGVAGKLFGGGRGGKFSDDVGVMSR